MKRKKRENSEEIRKQKNVKLIRKYKFSKYAIDDEVINSPLTERERKSIEKAFP